MPSDHRPRLSPRELAAVLAQAGLTPAEPAIELAGGMFARAYAASLTDGRDVVIKVAPVEEDGLLSHERDLMSTEVLVLRRAAGRPELRLPALLHADLTRTVVPADVMVTTRVPGVRWDTCGDALHPAARTRALREVGQVMARLHAMRGDHFGYPARDGALGARTWPAAFAVIVEAILADAAGWEVAVPADRTRAALERHRDALAQVREPALVHGDLWPGNVFLDPGTGAVLGVIDPERAMFADPLVDLVWAEPFSTEDPSAALLAGYADAAPAIVLTDDVRTRLDLYRLHLTLTMRIEAAPRRYAWPGLEEHLASLTTTIGRLLERLGV